MPKPRRLLISVAVLGMLLLAYFAACSVLILTNPERVLHARENVPVSISPAFLLGTATAAHQVEGGNTKNDWAAFEREAGHIARDEQSGRASDEWHRVPEDVRLMKSLGANAYRFSIEWSRLEPQQGTWDDAAWVHYQDELAQLHAANIEPMVTLLHFTLPQWLAVRGGLRAPDFPAAFARFAAEAAQRLGPQVHLWCTLNEPNVQMTLGYLDGRWPPADPNPQHAVEAFAALLRAHAAAARELHARVPGAQVGVAVNFIAADPRSRWNLLDWQVTYIARRAYDWSFYDSIASGRARLWLPGLPSLDQPIDGLRNSADFVGVNYYTRLVFHFSPSERASFSIAAGPGPNTDMNWEIYPDGMLRILREVHSRYALPIYITENGIADAAGNSRGAFIQSHLEAVAQAAREGIPVRGYFYWSLLDNFEWSEGFRPRLGLYRVDYKTERRTPAPGSEVFREWARRLASNSAVVH